MLNGQEEAEFCPCADLGLGPYASAVPFDYLLANGQAEAGAALSFAHRADLLKLPEELRQVFFNDSRARVGSADNDSPPLSRS